MYKDDLILRFNAAHVYYVWLLTDLSLAIISPDSFFDLLCDVTLHYYHNVRCKTTATTAQYYLTLNFSFHWQNLILIYSNYDVPW